jgi:short-subunit dehydrogenase
MQLNTKKVLLIGADGGIGSVIAEQLHHQGCQLILVGRAEDQLIKLNQHLGGQHHVFAADLTDEEARQRLVDQVKQTGGLDVLINNAGISDFVFAEQQDAKRLEALLTINLLVPMLLCQQFIPLLRQKKAGVIVNMGSTFGSIGYPGFSAYVASKFGLRGYTETLRRELADSSLRVIYLAPRAVKTPINTPAVVAMNEALGNAMDEPQVVADALVNLLKKNKNCAFLGWPEKLFVRVNGLFPRLVDNALRSKVAIIREYTMRHLGK